MAAAALAASGDGTPVVIRPKFAAVTGSAVNKITASKWSGTPK